MSDRPPEPDDDPSLEGHQRRSAFAEDRARRFGQDMAPLALSRLLRCGDLVHVRGVVESVDPSEDGTPRWVFVVWTQPEGRTNSVGQAPFDSIIASPEPKAPEPHPASVLFRKRMVALRVRASEASRRGEYDVASRLDDLADVWFKAAEEVDESEAKR